MSIFSGIIVVIVLIVLYTFLNRKNKKRKTRSAELQQKDAYHSTQFHSVSLKFSAYACKAAMDIQDERFLSNAAPSLPLPECDTPDTCNCKFVHHKDRRTIESRRSDYQLQQNIGFDDLDLLEEDNRKQKERRNNLDKP